MDMDLDKLLVDDLFVLGFDKLLVLFRSYIYYIVIKVYGLSIDYISPTISPKIKQCFSPASKSNIA